MRWGIVGTGGIAAAMAATIRQVEGGVVNAVASRSPERSARFAAAHGIRYRFESAGELAVCDDVDVVYVASSHSHHLADATASLEAGTPVLCEKPLTVSLTEAETLVATARRTGVFLMEAMWMRFQPFWDRLTEWIDSGRIGPLRHIAADFGINADPDPGRRWFDPAQGGGALLDVGIYPVTLACLLAGVPDEVRALQVAADTGVDAQTGMVLRHPGGVLSVLGCSFVADTGIEATLSGPDGRIRLDAPFHQSGRLSHRVGGDQIEEIDVSYRGSGYRWEVEEVHRCLSLGLSESPRHPLDATLGIMRVLERARGAI
ncbi:MAG: Gfo/Idh/MocA family oxidoreductase [Acidimicrobiia bacterium]